MLTVGLVHIDTPTNTAHVDRMQVKLMMPWSKTKHLAFLVVSAEGATIEAPAPADAASHIVASIQPLDETPTRSKMSDTHNMHAKTKDVSSA